MSILAFPSQAKLTVRQLLDLLSRALVLLSFITGGLVYSQDDDSIRQEVNETISKARETCEDAIEDARSEVVKELEKRQEAAQKRGDLMFVEKAIKEADAFIADGTLPSLVRASSYVSVELRERRTLLRVIEEGISRYTKAGMIDDAKFLRVESVQLDLVINSRVFRQYLGSNLLKNPSNDEALVLGRIPGWDYVSGNWTQRLESPPPADGEAYFFAGPGPIAELAQVVSIKPLRKFIDTSRVKYSFTGKVRCFVERHNDAAEIIIEFIGRTNRDVLEFYSSGPQFEAGRWLEITKSGIIPPGTTLIRIRLISTRKSGTNNDGYFDALNLSLDLEKDSYK